MKNKIRMNQEELDRFSEIIRQIKGNLTNREFAQKIGVSVYSISAWQSGSTTPTVESLDLIASYMKISTNELLIRIKGKKNKSLPTAESFYDLMSDLTKNEKIKLIYFLFSQVINE
jgi:transcriptional regulator with XRE-family HTH domain